MHSSATQSTSHLFAISDLTLLFIILFLLLLLVLIYLYFTSKLSKQDVVFSETMKKAKEMESNQNALLSSMSDDIYNLTQTLVVPEDEMEKSIEGEILTSANNLRELLKIQANKIEVYEEKFTFSHMLDDVTTYLASNFSERNTELVFEISPEVPRYLTGDVMHFSSIINNLLEYAIHVTPQGKVTLKITSDDTVGDNIILNVEVKDGSRGLTQEEFDLLFELIYDEKRHEQKGLQLYIAKKLTLAIGGTIKANRGLASGNTFNLQLPMHLNKESGLQEFSAFKAGITQKNVLIYSDKKSTGLALEKLFSHFYKEVKVVKRNEMDTRKINLLDFDILVLDIDFFNAKNKEYLKLVCGNKKMHIVACSSIFSLPYNENNELIDTYLKTPANLERIVELIDYLEDDNNKEATHTDEVSISTDIDNTEKLLVYKKPIEEMKNIDIDCFTYFKGSRLLIVEDNLINQKILASVLKKSGMEIEIANNGQEALDFLFVEGKQFDIVLMDISMPVMDGLLASERIRQKSNFDTMPIVTFTAFAMGAEIEQMFDIGCNAYLTKPLNIKKLYTVFDMFLTKSDREVSLSKSIEIEGLDIIKGIELADESEALYRETLKEFVMVYKHTVESIPKWIKEKRYDRVKLGCSEIQGILGAIGAYEMKALVDEMQKNFLYNKEAFLDEYILLYPEKLNNLMDAIHRYLKN